MQVKEVLERFNTESPLSVMARAAISRVLDPKRLDELFEREHVKQKCGTLLFSTIVDLMALVAIKAKPSVHAAYKHRQAEMTVAINSIYNKLQGIESNVSRSLVRSTAKDLMIALKAMKRGLPEPVLKGFTVRIVDGNHLAGTDHRIKELRPLGAAALPGWAMVIYDPDYKLVVDVIPCADAHRHESNVMPQVIETLSPAEVLVMDRGLGSKKTLTEIARKEAYYVNRQQSAVVHEWSSVGPRRKILTTENETIYEQPIQFHYEGEVYFCRRITIKLARPTRFDETEINLLTNLPKKVRAPKVCSVYRARWGIESNFCQLEKITNSEIQSLGYPQAALFSFSMGLFMLNVLNMIRIAVAAGSDEDVTADDISTYHVAIDIVSSWHGLVIAIKDEEFEPQYARLTMTQLGKHLVSLGKRVRLRCVLKSKRGIKHPPPQKISGNRGNHVSTARVLALNRT